MLLLIKRLMLVMKLVLFDVRKMVVVVMLCGWLMCLRGIWLVRWFSRFCCWVVFGLVRFMRLGVWMGLGDSVLMWMLWFFRFSI